MKKLVGLMIALGLLVAFAVVSFAAPAPVSPSKMPVNSSQIFIKPTLKVYVKDKEGNAAKGFTVHLYNYDRGLVPAPKIRAEKTNENGFVEFPINNGLWYLTANGAKDLTSGLETQSTPSMKEVFVSGSTRVDLQTTGFGSNPSPLRPKYARLNVRVKDSRGNPAANYSVQLVSYYRGFLPPLSQTIKQTDATGVAVFAVPPGKYYVSAMTPPSTTTRPQWTKAFKELDVLSQTETEIQTTDQ